MYQIKNESTVQIDQSWMLRCVDWKKDTVFNSKLLKVTLIRGATPLAAARHIFLQRVTERNFCLCRHRPYVQGQNDFVYIKPDGKYKVNYQQFGSYISKFSHLIMMTVIYVVVVTYKQKSHIIPKRKMKLLYHRVWYTEKRWLLPWSTIFPRVIF